MYFKTFSIWIIIKHLHFFEFWSNSNTFKSHSLHDEYLLANFADGKNFQVVTNFHEYDKLYFNLKFAVSVCSSQPVSAFSS